MRRNSRLYRPTIRSFYTAKPFREFYPVQQVPDHPRRVGYDGWKPLGLWYSCDNDWMEWLEHNWESKYNEAQEAYDYELEINPDAMLIIRTGSELVRFSRQYGQGNSAIRWEEVAQDYDGIEICPYQQDYRYALDWYYTWDVASGCIWGEDAFVGVRPINQKAQRQERRQMMSQRRAAAMRNLTPYSSGLPRGPDGRFLKRKS